MFARMTAGHSQTLCAVVLTLCCTPYCSTPCGRPTLTQKTHIGVRYITAEEHAHRSSSPDALSCIGAGLTLTTLTHLTLSSMAVAGGLVNAPPPSLSGQSGPASVTWAVHPEFHLLTPAAEAGTICSAARESCKTPAH
jgi:hypothetical protein